MNKKIFMTLLTGLLATTAQSKVSFDLQIDAITEADGTTAISDSGLLVLVVDTGENGFDLPTVGSLVSGDDEVVTYWDLDDYSFTSTDIRLVTEGGVNYGANWTADDSLALFWFPTLSSANMIPAADTVYGVFADAASLASGDAWSMPADGTLKHSLKLFTAAATKLVKLGDQPSSVGKTAYAVNTPPSKDMPVIPSLNVAQAGVKNVLSWSSSQIPTGGYIVQRRSDSGEWYTIGLTDSNSNTFDDTSVKAGKVYEYRLVSIGVFASSPSDTILQQAARSLFVNISSRASVDQDSTKAAFKLLNVGVQLYGTDPFKKLMSLGFGPHRNATIGTDAWVDDTYLEYEVGTTVVGINDDWMDNGESPGNLNPDAEDILTTMENVGSPVFFADDPESGFVAKDSALLEEVPINTTVRFRATSLADSGFIAVGLFDAEYDPATANDNRIVNLSSRGYLEAGGRFNGALVIAGDVPKEVLAVAVGPYLNANSNVPADVVLQNPWLDVERQSGPNGNVVVLENFTWDEQDGVPDPANGLISVETDVDRLREVLTSKNFNTDNMSLDAAVLVTLEPGNYGFRVHAENDGVSRPDGSVLIALWEIE